MSDDDSEIYSEKRRRGIRVVAWTVIIAMLLAGGAATMIALFLP